jgi:hypothetical protein
MPTRFRLLLAPILSFLVAYPASGLTLALVFFIRESPGSLQRPSEAALAFVFRTLWFGILTPMYGGFPPSDEGGINRLNMYPYIIPTWALLFLIFWRILPLARRPRIKL